MSAAKQPGPFVPSSTGLLWQIKAAEARFDAARSLALKERAERAFSLNKQFLREEREHDVRRHMYVGNCRAAIAKAGGQA